MYFTCIAGPLTYEAWACGKLWIALTAPFAAEVPPGFDSTEVY